MMSKVNQQSLRLLEDVESKLYAALDVKDFTTPNLEPSLQEYRSVCGDVMYEDFENTLGRNIEGRLWDTHVRINTRFRKQLGYFQEPKGKKKPVEQRKTASLYLKFIKSSQHFYRGHIQRLAANYGGVPELELIAQRFSFDAPSPLANKPLATPGLQVVVLQSCHQALIHLGDLSRYRESELGFKKKEPNWGPAIGYYDLAIASHPSSGIPYNQLAIISKAQVDDATTLYNLYRALSAYESPPTAFDNLNLEFRKIREAWNRDELHNGSDVSREDSSRNFQRWFPFLHACCFDGIDMVEYGNPERKTLEHFAAGLEDRSLKPNFVNRMVLSNIAADFAAGDRWQDAPEVSQNEHVFRLFQRLNVCTFTLILRLLQVQCDNQAIEHGMEKGGVFPSVARRLLPCVRYYQSWLASRATLFSIHLSDVTMGPLVQELWVVYVATLSSLVSVTNFEDVPRLEYMLEEDEEVIGFRPLQDGHLQQQYADTNSQKRKPKCHEGGFKRHHPNIEMLCRVRDFVEDALELSGSDYVPIQFVRDSGRFVIEESMLNSVPSQSSFGFTNRASTAEQDSIAHPQRMPNHDAESTTDDAISLGASTSLSLGPTMNQMVDDLVDADPAHPSTFDAPGSSSVQGVNGANETSYAIGESTLTVLNRMADVPKPPLPSILNSPFAPQPKEGSALSRSPASKCPTADMQQRSQQQQPPPQSSLDSTSSSMSEPTQLSYLQKGPYLNPSLRKKAFGIHQQHATGLTDDFNFDSSNIIAGSSFPYNSGRDQVTQPTPPNGQG
ncbi:MAG: hypothetical protein Q9218_001969 [Villophora microphyllina]